MGGLGRARPLDARGRDDERLSLLAVEPELAPTVARLRCFRGIETLSALVLHLEVGDWRRFQRPAQLAAWLGLVPALHQSGESETRGAITKTGSGSRRILVEAASHYLREPRIGITLRERQTGQPAHILQIAWRAQHRLHRLHGRLRARQTGQRRHRRRRARTRLLPLDGSRGRVDQRAATSRGRRRDESCRHARRYYGPPSRPRPPRHA